MADATVILSLLKKVSKHFRLDFKDVLNLCDMSTSNASNASTEEIPCELEYISLGGKGYLYDPQRNNVYSNPKKGFPKRVGKLCTSSFELILHQQ
jgi:hypothetical protein